MNFPKFEKRTNIVFHLWGGLGVAKYTAKINALNGDTMYNYTGLSAQPSVSDITAFYDKSYETVADGNSSSGSTVFAPSCGLGLGYRFSKNVALVFEHKITFPRVDVIDGQQWKDDLSTTARNDYYHYTAAHLIFTIYGKSHKGTTNTNTNTTTTNTTTTNNNYTPKPIISIYTPPTNPYTTTSNIQQVSGTIKYVTSSAGVSITVNGMPLSNFDFNPNNGSLGFNTNLNPGINNVTITASNPAGQDSENIEINYTAPQFTNQPVATELPPKVVINYPSNNYLSTLSSTNVNAVISNISSSANIAVSVNSIAISNFNYNSFSGALSFVAPLNAGNNSIVVSAFNTAGNDAQQVFVKYTPTSTQAITPKGEPKPVVSFHNPPSTPYESTIKNFSVTAHVSNVTSANQLTVLYNGVPVTNFTFSSYGFVNFNANLNVGSNSVIITGTNTAGSDTKTVTINYKETGKAPVVKIIEPALSPYVTEAVNCNVVAKIENVQNQSDINVMLNNVVVPFTYNTLNQTATIQANLNAGKNVVIVSAANIYGSDSKTQLIERTVKLVKKPAVTIINPAVSPLNSFVSSQQVVAQVFNVTSSSEIQVKGQANLSIPFNYDATTQQILFTVNLATGANLYTVTATNTAGTDSKSVTINYTPKATPILEKPPVVNFVNPATSPFSTFDGNMNVIATVTNVATQQGITVKLNNANINFTFNTTTKEIVIPSNLNLGSNSITVTATNIAGSDSKTQIIDRKEFERCLLSPVVNIVIPGANPYSTTNATENVRAEVLNVTGASSIQVTNQNGQAVNFTYDATSHYVNFVATLVAGNNIYKVKATNNVDAVSESVNIIYTKIVSTTQTPIKVSKPVVNFTNPSQINTTIQIPTQAISASVTNVSDVSGISVQVNGQAQTSFTYINGVVALVLNCNEGSNTITITGTNVAGFDAKTIFVNYKKPAPPLPLPVVTFVSPNVISSVTSSSSSNVNATVLNVTSASQVLVQVNGAAISNFTFVNGVVNFVANLNLGSNTIVVTGKNDSGSDTKTISIIYEKPEPPIIINPPVITYVVPSSSSFTTNNSSENIRMMVTNVTNSSQITVKVNGINLSGFVFNHGRISFNANFSLGANTILVSATNAGGSDSKQISVNYELPVVPAPIVTILNPAPDLVVTESSQSVEATVTNVTSSSQLQVTINGNAVSGFSFNNGNLSFIASLDRGPNVISIKGINVSGSDTKVVTITYKLPVAPPVRTQDPPVITFFNPSVQVTNVSVASQAISATATYLDQNQVTVKVNGSLINNFTFTNSTVNFVAQLNQGSNSVEISGTNIDGTDTKSITINYAPPATVVNPPVVTITSPSASTSTLNNVQNVTANVTEVNSSSQVSVSVNNVAISNFTFVNGSVNFVAPLTIGSNAVKVTGTNSGGTDSKTITITRQAPPAPSVSISIPSANPYTSATAIVNITANVLNVASSSEISVTKNGAAVPFTYNAATNIVNFSYTLTGNATFVITASNNNGSDSKSLVVNYTMPVVDPEIVICHKPPGNPTNTQQLTIPQSAWPAHQAHGDELGTCPTPTITPNNGNNNGSGNNNGNSNGGNNNDPQITICHKPPGNPTNTQELTIPQSAWAAHQAHGDVLGTCPAAVNPPAVSIVNPSSVNITTQNSVQSVAAVVTNVTSASQVVVVLNNTPITDFTFSNGNVSFSVALTVGLNTIIITGTNDGGTDSKTISITRQTQPAPTVTITSPTANPYTSPTANITVTGIVANVADASEINVKADGNVVPFTYDATTDVLSFNFVLQGNTRFAVTAANAYGRGSKNIVVNYTGPIAEPEIIICHKPPGNPTNTQELTIPQSAWPAHQAHGDDLGPCPKTKGNGNNGNENKDNKDNSTPGTILNGIKGLMTPTNNAPKTNTNTQPTNSTPKTNTNTQPTNTTPKTNTNTQPTNTTPKATEPKKEEPKVTPRTVQPTTTTPTTVAPTTTTPVKATTPSTVTEGTSTPRVIKPR
jgi:hypothetical protein